MAKRMRGWGQLITFSLPGGSMAAATGSVLVRVTGRATHISWAHGITLDPSDDRKVSEQVHQQLGCPLMSVHTSDGCTSLSGLVAQRFGLSAITEFSPPFIISPPFGHSPKVRFSSFFEKNISHKKCFLLLLDSPGTREDEQEALIL